MDVDFENFKWCLEAEKILPNLELIFKFFALVSFVYSLIFFKFICFIGDDSNDDGKVA